MVCSVAVLLEGTNYTFLNKIYIANYFPIAYEYIYGNRSKGREYVCGKVP